MRFVQDLISLYIFILIVAVILSWIPSRDASDGLVKTQRVLYKLTEPVLRPLRAIVPRTHSGIDFSPIVACLLLGIIRAYI